MTQAALQATTAGAASEKRHEPRLGGLSWREALFLAVIAVTAWRAIVVNVSDYYSQEGKPENVRQALSWNAKHPRALVDLSLEQIGGDQSARLPRLRAAAAVQPADGRLHAALALQAESDRAPELAANAMLAATHLAPQRSDVRLAAYQFWLRQNDVGRALESAQVVLNREPQLATELFPQFLRLMAHPGSDEAFAALLKKPIRWWPAFFEFVAGRAPNVDVLRALHALQRQGPNVFTEAQLRTYLNRLQHDGQWLDAYFVWFDSLPRDAVTFAGELQNGGFEETTRSLGFEWIDQPVPGVLVGFDPTYGTTGLRALHVVFQGLKAQWQHFGQNLMLPPGEYTVRGRVRIDSLQAERGVQWRLSCLGAAAPLLGTSDRFKGTDQWRYFSFGVNVPGHGCGVQELRLELVGKAQLDFVAEGQIWFDDLSILRK